MDLIIKNASLEEVTAICYRIGEPNFAQMVEANRKFGVVEYLANHDIDLKKAEETYDKDLENIQTQVAIENDQYDEIPEIPPETNEPEPKEIKENDLHLEKPPEQPKETVVNLEESLHQLATKLVQEKGPKALIDILNSFGAKSLPDLSKSHYETAVSRIKEVL